MLTELLNGIKSSKTAEASMIYLKNINPTDMRRYVRRFTTREGIDYNIDKMVRSSTRKGRLVNYLLERYLKIKINKF